MEFLKCLPPSGVTKIIDLKKKGMSRVASSNEFFDLKNGL
jgi:hypothetical protein